MTLRTLTLTVFLFAGDSRAQNSLATCGSVAPGTGTIQGRLIPDSIGIRPRRAVHVISPRCMTLADEQGNYVLRGLPPGNYEVGIGDLGVRRVRPIPIRVGPDSTSRLDIHLQPPNTVLDCLDVPACAVILSPLPPGEASGLASGEQLLEIAVRMAIANSHYADAAERRPGALCIGSSPTAPIPSGVLEVVRRRIPIARPVGDCTQVSVPGRVRYELRTPDSLWAWRYVVQVNMTSDSTATSNSSYHVGPLWAEGWECQFRRAAAGWKPERCVGTWIS